MITPPGIGRIEVAIDCRDLDLVAGFWTALLGYGPAEAMDARYLAAEDPRGVGPRMVFQAIDDAMHGCKSAFHLDLHVGEVEGTVQRVIDLGGRRLDLEPINEAGSSWIRCADPEGNVFCVVLER